MKALDESLYHRMLPLFLAEADGCMRDLAEATAALERDHTDAAAWHRAARAAHTIKGNAATLGLRALMAEAHTLEARSLAGRHGTGGLTALCLSHRTLRGLLAQVAADAAAREPR